MSPDVRVGPGLQADQGVGIGCPSARSPAATLVVGEHAQLRTGTVVYLGSRLGARFATGHNVVIREECEIGDDVSVWSNSVVDYGCRIGDRVKIHSNCYVAQFTEIDDDAFLAPGVMIANDLYPGSPESAMHMSGPSIGAGAQIGVNATVLPYLRIGAGTVVGAGAVVTHDLPPGSVAYGSPARVHGSVRDLVDAARLVTAGADRAAHGADGDPSPTPDGEVG
jgi:acetyltransferase-like isoleucine patch superfamily enzyme